MLKQVGTCQMISIKNDTPFKGIGKATLTTRLEWWDHSPSPYHSTSKIHLRFFYLLPYTYQRYT